MYVDEGNSSFVNKDIIIWAQVLQFWLIRAAIRPAFRKTRPAF